MEVTTVSPSPASPTEGDDLCETDVTNVAIHSVTLLICLCGLVGNGAVLRLLSMEEHNYYIFNLAFSDFLFLLFTVPSALLFLVEDMSCSPIVPLLYLNFLFQLSAISGYGLLFWTMWNTGSEFVSEIFKLQWLCSTYCPCNISKRLLWLLGSVQFWVFFALFAVIPAVTYLCPSQQQEHCRAALIFMYTIMVLLFAVPLVISSTIKIIDAKKSSSKVKLKTRHIIVFLIVLFILLLSLCNFLWQLGYRFVSSEVVFLLNCIQSSIKPFIYFLVGRCWSPCSLESLQLSLWRVFDEEKEKEFAEMLSQVTQRSEPGDLFPSTVLLKDPRRVLHSGIPSNV